MASTITNYSNLIDTNYPVPGQDNDSQGFRSNFSSIQNALGVTGDEITSLQKNLVTLSSTNNFNDNKITRAIISSSTVILKNLSLSELATLTESGTVENGSLVFVVDDSYDCPAYYNNGTWYAFTGTSVTLV